MTQLSGQIARRSAVRRVVSLRRSTASRGSRERSWRQVKLTQNPELRRISVTRSGESYFSPHDGQITKDLLLVVSPAIPISPPLFSPAIHHRFREGRVKSKFHFMHELPIWARHGLFACGERSG